MIASIIGAILLLFPFLLITLFKDKKRGFVYVLFFLILFHTALAFFTQFFGIFYYWVIVLFSFLVNLGIILFFVRQIKFSSLFKIDWVMVLVIIIAFLSLWQVHYNYTGKINIAKDTTVSYHEVKNMEYVYPYFSDEWYAVSLVKHSINYHALPLWNDLNNSFFPNLEMFFHSFVAEIMLILNLDPLAQYTLISILFNTLIICLAYIFLRINKVSKLASAIASLSILYITCGANLPGIWNFIPMHLGIIFCLIGFCFMAMDKPLIAGLASFPVIFFYGPLFIFYGTGLLVFLAFRFKESIKRHIAKITPSLIIFFLSVPVFYIILMISPLANSLKYIISRVFYVSLYGPNIPIMNFFNIIPIWTILIAILGLIYIFKNIKWFFSAFILGVIFWIFYSFTINRFVIEYERVVFFISILITIISGFGLNWLEKRARILKFVEIGAIVLFLLFVPLYTQRENWKMLILANTSNGTVSYPKAPANTYLTNDDLIIFGNIKNKRFLSIPWKGTVLGVATGNYPLVSKEGNMFTGQEIIYKNFLDSDCSVKKNMAKNMNLDYVYTNTFECSSFEKVSESSEGLVLYKFNKS